MKIFGIFILTTASLQLNAMGIAGKSGDELLYLYILFILLALSFIGLDHLIKFAKQKFHDWKSRRHLHSMDDLN
jgi:hypothetical protein